ncbi:HAMP domain-containing protein [Candidatus Woesearchaeota archaeon]|nr:HAMP domain-containing protein [Candidatus Woesearchaeota archaeon]
MKLFQKAFIIFFCFMLLVILSLSFILTKAYLSDTEQALIEQNRVYGDIISRQIEVGYLQSNWPFENLNKLAKRDDFLFWWVVKQDGNIYRANNVSFIGTSAQNYFPEINYELNIDNTVYLNRNHGYGIYFKNFKFGQETLTFWLGFSLGSIAEKTNSIMIRVTLVSTSVLMVLTVLLYFAVNYLTNPIKILRDNTVEISKGNLNIKTNIKSTDEIGDLASAFNRMTTDLKKFRSQLENYNKNLEKSIEARTKELDRKIKEAEESQIATLNILDDVDESNKELIGARKELQEKIKELKLMDKKKDEFLSVTAHELKTPLTSIRGFIQILKNEKIMRNRAVRTKYFNIIISDTHRLEKLITDILDLSRLDLGTMKFNFELTEIADIFKELTNLSSVSIKEKGLKSIFKFEKDIPELITDKSRLLQVLSNLINNSVKYTEKGYIKIEAVKKNSFVYFSVTDTGIGIPKEEHTRIFDRFYQIDSSYTRKVGGSGLGLAICKGIVEALGGKIWTESNPGKGAKFIFTLPLRIKRRGKQLLDLFREQNKKINDSKKKPGKTENFNKQ